MAAMESTHRRRPIKVIGLCAAWFLLSSANNVIGKKLLTKYPYPVTITLSHMLAVSIYMYPILAFSRISTQNFVPFRSVWSVLLPLGCGKLLSSITSHVSIWKVPVSYAHTVKAMMPIFTVLLSRLLFQEKQTWKVYASLLPIIAGVAIATVTEISFDKLGLLSALTATLLFAIQNLYSKRAIKLHGINHLQLLQQMGQVSLAFVIPVWIISDSYGLWQDQRLADWDTLVWFLFLLATSGLINFGQSILAFSVLNLLSPLSYSVSNASKRICVITVSLLALKNPVTPINVLGMLTAIVGVLVYNKAKIEQNKVALQLPTNTTQTSPVSHTRHRIYELKQHAYI